MTRRQIWARVQADKWRRKLEETHGHKARKDISDIIVVYDHLSVCPKSHAPMIKGEICTCSFQGRKK